MIRVESGDFKVDASPVRSPEIRFAGFSSEQAHWLQGRFADIGLPTRNIREAVYLPNTLRKKNVVGHWREKHLTGGYAGEFALYKRFEDPRLPEIAHLATIVHELGHVNSPLKETNADLYGGEKNREKAVDLAWQVAAQTDATGVYMNGYHRALHRSFVRGEIGGEHFVEETNAIMLELRFVNPNHLMQVQEAQNSKLQILLGTREQVGVDIVSGLDETIANLLSNNGSGAQFTPDMVDAHVLQVRESFDKQKSPFVAKANNVIRVSGMRSESQAEAA
jgi:hypothetical protein